MYRLPGGDAQPAGQAPPPTFLAMPDPGRWTWGRGEDPLGTALAEVGLAVGDLRRAVVSHLHGDHAGGIGTLARAGVPWRHTSTRSPPPDPGHPRSHPGPRVAAGGPARDGHVALPRRAAEPAQDVIDVLPPRVDHRQPAGQAEESLHRLAALAAETRARIVCGHDPVVMHAAGHPPGGHR